MKLEKRKFVFFTFVGAKRMYCQFGCDGVWSKITDLYQHWFENHTYEELKKWGVNRNILNESMSSTKQEFDNTKATFVTQRVEKNGSKQAK